MTHSRLLQISLQISGVSGVRLPEALVLSTAINSKKSSIKRGDSALSNDATSKFNDAIFDYLELFDYLHLRPLKGSGGLNL
jgi:hypothetical protein